MTSHDQRLAERNNHGLVTTTHRRRKINLVDSAMTAALGRKKFFGKGWGDIDAVELVEQRFHEQRTEVPDIHVRWITLPYTHNGITRMRGYFESPASAYLPLPPETRAAYFELLLPEGAGVTLKPPVCLHLASTGEQGMARRTRFATPLIERGVGALILENPYYGIRRPRGQKGVSLLTVADQLMMCMATVEEARALLKWLRRDGYKHLGVSGYSMGGSMAAYVAALEDEPIAAVPISAGASSSSIFTGSPMARYTDWRALGGKDSRELLRGVLDALSLELLPKPAAPELAILVSGTRDSVVAPDTVRALANHWGSEIRWYDSGHIAGYVLCREFFHDAILDAFGMLMVHQEK